MAGFRVRRLINEPTAAAFAYGLEKKKEEIFSFMIWEVVPLTFHC